MVFGCAAMDMTAQQRLEAPHSTAPGTVRLSAGGVALNVARAAHSMLSTETDVLLCAPYGSDVLGSTLFEEIQRVGLRTDALIPADKTAVCNLLLNATGELVTGTADMDVVEMALTPDFVCKHIKRYSPPIVCVDANMRSESLASLLDASASARSTVLFEPTSVQKCRRLVEAVAMQSDPRRVHIITPNQYELSHMAKCVRELIPNVPQPSLGIVHGLAARWGLSPTWLQDALLTSTLAHTQFIKLGPHGVLVVTHAQSEETPHMVHMPAESLDPEEAMNSTGAGDSFTGAVLAGMTKLPNDPLYWTLSDVLDLAHVGQQAARRTLYSPDAVAGFRD